MLSSFFPGSCPCRFLFEGVVPSLWPQYTTATLLTSHFNSTCFYNLPFFFQSGLRHKCSFLLSTFKRWFKDVQMLRHSRFADASRMIQRWLNVDSLFQVRKKESLFRLSLTAYLPYPLPTQERSFYRKVSWAWNPWNVLWTLCGQSPVFAKFLQSYCPTALGLSLQQSSNT